jgi:uncharacterized spore protein YtfJ
VENDNFNTNITTEGLEELARRIGETASVQFVFGNPVERDGVTVIPVAQASWGFEHGGSKDGRTPGSNGGGATVRPVGFIELSGGKARYRPILDWMAAVVVGLAGLALGILLGVMARRS